ncbi:class I SAM-dependent DNA methyltransferase [Tundrisphaera lichenicola]|uniref:class I SAM-dependent DNA methyltransferase n=1 Tax=Tundrisphaera lichenicola TaxID=2029860 RepID=UPI003EB76A42
MIDRRDNAVRASYDVVAEEYARRIFGELADKPLDRQLLDRFAGRANALGPVCDLGCGPGHVARYLRERGTDIIGIDLSDEMASLARQLNPAIEFRQGDMRSLCAEDRTWGSIIAFYSLIHIPRDEVANVLTEIRRVLRPGGLLLLALHIGDDSLHLDEWWGREASIDFHFFRPEEMTNLLRSAGFWVEEIIERDPYPDVEHPSRRVYIFAQKPNEEAESS